MILRRPLCSLSLLLSFALSSAASPWDLPWGDLGDGTYRNPIINGDFADSDVEWDPVTQHWYLITSTNHLTPGMSVLASRDLVNWRYAGHVWPRLTWRPVYEPSEMNGYKWGTWAGDLSHHKGTWYCVMIDKTYGLILSTAPSPTGPWSEPVTLHKRENWTDPALAWDEATGQGYLIVNWGASDTSPKKNDWDQKVFKLSPDARSLLDSGTTVYTGNRTEAAKLQFIDNRWYILAVDWVGNDRKQIALRSTTTSVYGPYERKVIFERGNGFNRSACQGSLLQIPDGSWWYIHQLVQNGTPNFHGRPQCLQPVTWKNGWPIPGEDVDADGIGEPIWTHKKPAISASGPPGSSLASASGAPDSRPAPYRLATSDDFSSSTLGFQWLWNHNPRADRWSLAVRPGHLRLIASRPVAEGGFWRAPNTLSQPILGAGRGDAIATLDVSGLQPGQVAGLCHFAAKFYLIGIRVSGTGERSLYVSLNGKETSGPALSSAQTTVHLRSSWLRDAAEPYAYSLDGKTWTPLGPAFRLEDGNWRGDRIGFYTWNPTTDAADSAGFIDIDSFTYTHGPATGAQPASP